MLFKLIILLSIIIINFLLYSYYKKLNNPQKHIKKPCDFKISSLKKTTCKNTGAKYAKFRVSLDDKHIFLRNFPILFKFHSNNRFKSKIKIQYSTTKKEGYEEIMNKVVEFETFAKEHIYKIDDLILGQIYITLESKSEYGDPIIEFEILENSYCNLIKDQKLIIDFSKF